MPKNGDGLLLFQRIFLRNRSLNIARWFTVKNAKFGRGNLWWTKNLLGENEMWWAVENHNYTCHPCIKEFLNSNFLKESLTKYQIVKKMPEISHTHKNLPYKYHVRCMRGIFFFNFASCEPFWHKFEICMFYNSSEQMRQQWFSVGCDTDFLLKKFL